MEVNDAGGVVCMVCATSQVISGYQPADCAFFSRVSPLGVMCATADLGL